MACMISSSISILLVLMLYEVVGMDLTKGFISQHLNESNLVIQRPYDVPENQRYSFKNGVHKLWVFKTDKPHTPISRTNPRTEIRIQLFTNGVHTPWVYSTGNPLSRNSNTKPRTEIIINGYDYSFGVWQFEAYGYVPCGTSGVCIMQVFGSGTPHATTLMLRAYNGTLSYYRAPVIMPNIYDRWFKLNVIHDVEASKVQVYIDGVLKYEAHGRGGASHYFKCGVYAQNDDSYYMESRWKKIRVLKKCD